MLSKYEKILRIEELVKKESLSNAHFERPICFRGSDYFVVGAKIRVGSEINVFPFIEYIDKMYPIFRSKNELEDILYVDDIPVYRMAVVEYPLIQFNEIIEWKNGSCRFVFPYKAEGIALDSFIVKSFVWLSLKEIAERFRKALMEKREYNIKSVESLDSTIVWLGDVPLYKRHSEKKWEELDFLPIE